MSRWSWGKHNRITRCRCDSQTTVYWQIAWSTATTMRVSVHNERRFEVLFIQKADENEALALKCRQRRPHKKNSGHYSPPLIQLTLFAFVVITATTDAIILLICVFWQNDHYTSNNQNTCSTLSISVVLRHLLFCLISNLYIVFIHLSNSYSSISSCCWSGRWYSPAAFISFGYVCFLLMGDSAWNANETRKIGSSHSNMLWVDDQAWRHFKQLFNSLIKTNRDTQIAVINIRWFDLNFESFLKLN